MGTCIPSACSLEEDVKRNFERLYNVYGVKMGTFLACVDAETETYITDDFPSKAKWVQGSFL